MSQAHMSQIIVIKARILRKLLYSRFYKQFSVVVGKVQKLKKKYYADMPSYL